MNATISHGGCNGDTQPPTVHVTSLALVRRAGTAPVPSGNGNPRGHMSLEDYCLQSWPLDTKAPLYFKLEEGRLRLEVRKKNFTQRAMRHSHRLPREARVDPSLEVLQAKPG